MLSAARIFGAITAESIARVGEGITLPQLRVLVLASQPGQLNATGVAQRSTFIYPRPAASATGWFRLASSIDGICHRIGGMSS
jgi:hypothetical protein